MHSTTLPAFPLAQSIDHAHKLGCHHVCTAKGGAGKIAASAGFGGEVKIWRLTDAGDWVEHWALLPTDPDGSDVWAVALSSDERYLAGTTHDGRVRIWDLEARTRIEEFKPGTGSVGSFALTVDLSRDGRLTAAGTRTGRCTCSRTRRAGWSTRCPVGLWRAVALRACRCFCCMYAANQTHVKAWQQKPSAPSPSLR